MFKSILILLTFPLIVSAQFEDQVPKPKLYDPAKIVDSTYGIGMYKKLLFYLGGDSVRNDKRGYACNGWIEDHYKSGKVLHRGYYVDGYLKVYKNFYENGGVERNFENIGGDASKGRLNTFYPNGKLKSTIIYDDRRPLSSNAFYAGGQLKSEVKYVNKNPVKWLDYFENGQLQMVYEYDDNFQYLIKNLNYYPDGKPRSLIELIDVTAKRYRKKEYFSDGQIKEEGELLFDAATNNYNKDGRWLTYDTSGKLFGERTYVNGQ